jgi:hypothetical protein
MKVSGMGPGASGSLRRSGWLLLVTLASVTSSSGCWCKDCASLTISLPQPDDQADYGLVVDVSAPDDDSAIASCTWARTSTGSPPSGSWTCTHDGRSTTTQGTAELYFDVQSAGGTCTITITDTHGSRSLKQETKTVGSDEATMVGCGCDGRGVTLTTSDLDPPAG